jgi:hypothetical protein
MEEASGTSRPQDIRPPKDACCAGCGGVLGDEWVSYRQDPDSPETLPQDFSQVVQWETRRGQRGAALAGTFKGFSRATREHSPRVFRDPDDLGLFFHPRCGPKLKLTEKMEHDLATMLADILIADMKQNPEKYANRASGADSQGDPTSQVAAGQSAKPMIKLEWHRFAKLTEARSRFAKTPCVYIQADSKGCPIRIGKATEGLEARYRGGTGYAIDAAMHGSGNLVFVAAVERDLCACVEDELIWQGRRCLTYNNQGKTVVPVRRVLLSHSGLPPMLKEFDGARRGE